jgi:rod shape-determining protein MreC
VTRLAGLLIRLFVNTPVILMLKRPHYIALGLVVLLTLIILNLPSQARARLKLGIGALFVPLFGLAGSAHQLAAQSGDAVVPRSELLKELENLRRDNQELWVSLRQSEDAKRENLRLRQYLNWQPRKDWKLKLARVILREPANWWRSVEIDLGARNGLSNNLPVLSPAGFLVGRVSSVSSTRAQVVLLGDRNCRVAARVENEARDTGVIGASGPLDSEFVDLGYLSRNAALKPGQDVKTSGLGGIFPPEIPIGKIVDFQTVEYGLGTVAQVKLGANLNALEEVWVMFP